MPYSTRSLASEMLNKVPEVTVIFWIIKIMSTTVGETGADHLAVHAGLGSGGGKTGGTADLDRIQVAHQDHGRGGIGFTESTHRVQHEGQPGTTCQRALGAALDHRAIGHGV